MFGARERESRTRLILCWSWLVAGLLCRLGAQPPLPTDPGAPTLRLVFAESVGRVGQEATLPIRASANRDLRTPFKIVLRFPPSRLEYRKLGIGSLPRQAGWTLSAQVRTSPPAFDMSFLEIRVEPSEQDIFPEGGLLGEAYFTILEAGEEHSIELPVSVRPAGNEELRLEAEPAVILAQPAAMFACLFYMH